MGMLPSNALWRISYNPFEIVLTLLLMTQVLGTEDMTDDELIEAHEKDLRRVLGVLDKDSKVCKPTKASLFVREVKFAGDVVSHGQRRPMPGKLAALRHWKKPETIGEL